MEGSSKSTSDELRRALAAAQRLAASALDDLNQLEQLSGRPGFRTSEGLFPPGQGTIC